MTADLSKLNYLKKRLYIILTIAFVNILISLFSTYSFSLERAYRYERKQNSGAYDTRVNSYGFVKQANISVEYTGAIIACGFIAMACMGSIVWIEITKVKLQHNSLNQKNTADEIKIINSTHM
ncbi:hypothetical protein KORDIASMS9_03852 [Kordia sp. SMS9]|uniref:hypothetical protein n=1 Tax=Kordia sp. SMS9 TaxID=2282170 RepID=UPI000E0D5CFB|nr:hypothetical protein [Kordia sp. SMS9]AXG71595.1 hypothetical protein KORDIASMS9_03852 [Kordia sp. SMS9]